MRHIRRPPDLGTSSETTGTDLSRAVNRLAPTPPNKMNAHEADSQVVTYCITYTYTLYAYLKTKVDCSIRETRKGYRRLVILIITRHQARVTKKETKHNRPFLPFPLFLLRRATPRDRNAKERRKPKHSPHPLAGPDPQRP